MNAGEFIVTEIVDTAGSLYSNTAYDGGCGVAPACVFSFLPDEDNTKFGVEAQIENLTKCVKQLVKDTEAIHKRIRSIEDRYSEPVSRLD